MKKSVKKAIPALIVASCILIATAICSITLRRFDYSDHLDEVVITVDDRSVSLKEFGYYIYEVEAFVQKQALIYDPENPKHWWNTHFSAGPDSQFVCDYAKKVALNICIADEVYYQEAVSHGIILSTDEVSQATDEGRSFFAGMDPVQIRSTGLDENTVVTMSMKHTLASKYSMYLIESEHLALQSTEPAKLVNWDGSYYLQKVLPKHVTWTNDKLLGEITFGKITVNL